jgi:hypothetical protein
VDLAHVRDHPAADGVLHDPGELFLHRLLEAAPHLVIRRRVIAFSSHVHLDPPRFAVEIFRLATNEPD